MVIYKRPIFQDDSYMFVIDLEKDVLAKIEKDTVYYLEKKYSFKHKDIDKQKFEAFKDRPSFANFDDIQDLAGTIYTHTCEGKNKLDYEHIIKYCKKYHKKSRRCAINFADTLADYLQLSKNTSCLNSIHFYKDNVTVYFRASDIQNELLIDLHLIMQFFVQPVGNFKTLTVMSSTAQNIHFDLNNLVTSKWF